MAYIKDVQVGSDTYLIEPTLYIAPTKNGAAYTATLTNFSLVTGATVQAKFAATNDANATLNVNSTGAKEIHYNGAKITASQFKVNHVYTLVYDGTQWQVVGDIDTNTNTWRGIQDNLTSDSTTESLSAKQGKVLKGLIDAMDASTPAASGNATAFIDSITQTDGKITSITKKNIPTVSSSTAGLAPKGTAVSTQSTSTKFLREDGTWATPSYITNTDAKVAQSSNTEDKEFPIILKNTDNTTNETNGVKYDGDVTVNPSKSKITATTIQANSRLVASKAISQIITGTGTAGSYTNSTYHPAKWTFNTGLTATDGDIFTIKIPVAGHDYGVFMSVDNGSHYYPVVLNGTERITTHYPINTYITVIFEPTGSAASMYALAGQTSSTRTTVTGGVWRVLNYRDTNSNDIGYYHRRIYPNLKAGGAIHPYSIIMQLPNGRWSGITTTAPNNPGKSNVSPVATGKTANASGFMLGHVLLMYANTTYADANNIGTYNIWSAYTGLIDARYSFNLANSTGNGFVAYTPVYIVGTVSDGLFHLDATKWWTQTLPSSDDGKVYIYIGDAYDWYRLTFTEDKPIYWYKDGALRLYAEGRGIKDITRSGTTFTATRDDGSTFNFTQQDNNTTYTFANGTNGFTVTPSGGTAQTVTVTPSIANNITGSGTANYLTKFTGANTIGATSIAIDSNNNLTIPSKIIKFTGLGEGLEITQNNDYFGSNSDARIISIIDSNPGAGSTAVDGGLIIQAIGRVSNTDTIQELLRIRNNNGSADWKTGEFQWKTKDIVVELGKANKTWDISIAGNAATATYSTQADYLHPYTDGTNVPGTTDIQILTTLQADDNIPRSTPFGVLLQHGNHSVGFGYFYPKSSQYGGWYIANYSGPSYIGLNNGTWKTYTFLTNQNYTNYTVTKTGTGASGTWGISITGTAAEATADASGNTITSTYATKTEVAAIEIGGRNLLKKSHSTAQEYTYPTSKYSDKASWTTATVLYGGTYTLSFWAKSTVDGDIIRVHFYNPSNITSVKGSQGQNTHASDGLCDFTLSTTWTKYWVTYTIPIESSTRSVITPRLQSGSGTGTVSFMWEKLEAGHKATDWSPAWEDLALAADYLPLSGGTMTGAINLVGNQSSAYNDKGLIFTKGSRIGENTSGGLGIYGAERIYLRPNSPTAGSGDGIEISGDGIIPSNNNTESFGDSSHKWANVYATNLNGNLSVTAHTNTTNGSKNYYPWFSTATSGNLGARAHAGIYIHETVTSGAISSLDFCMGSSTITGSITLWDGTNHWGNIKPVNLSDNRSYKLPNQAGTFALLTQTDANALINLLSTGTSDLTANDYVITQYVGGGTTNITYYRRPASKVVNATLVKAALGTDTSTTTQWLNKKGLWSTPTAADVGAITKLSSSTDNAIVRFDGTTGAIQDSGVIINDNDHLIAPAIRIANTYYGVSFGRTTGTPKETILHTGIKWVSSTHMPVIHITGYAYGLQSPVEFKIGFYIYEDKIGWSGATNMGSWEPDIYLFKDTRSETNYVAVGLAGSCYFLQLSVDLQDEMGKFNNVIPTDWSWDFLTTEGTIPSTDDGTTCVKVPYKASIFGAKYASITTTSNAIAYYTNTTGTFGSKASANGALYATSADGALQWGTLPIAQGGTGKTTANDAANTLISGLPIWTANPTDDTYLIRRDNGGTATYAQVKFSTVWNYIKGKADSIYATQNAMNGLLAAADAMIFKGTLGTGGTITALPATHNAGDTYRVITAGTWAGKYCEVGTLIICIKDGTAAADADWTSVETNEDGAVIGPSAATDNGIVLFSGNTGRIIKNSSKTLTTTAPSTDSGDTTIPTSKAVWTTVNTAITGLDFTAVGGDTGEYISKISQTDGKISATKATTSVSNIWAAGTTAGPTIKTTVNGITGTAVAIPSASNTASGVITTGEQTFAGIKTFANTTASTSTDTGAILIGGGLGVAGQVTAIRLAANGSNTSYNLYVNGTSLLNGNTTVNGNLIPGANNTKTLGSTSARWSKLYIGTADTHGDAYTPIYWNDGVPTAVTPIQYCAFTINSGKKGVKLTHAAFTATSYVTQIVIIDGESNLNSAIEWESAAGYINLTCSATSGAVVGYILVSRGGAITATATDIT